MLSKGLNSQDYLGDFNLIGGKALYKNMETNIILMLFKSILGFFNRKNLFDLQKKLEDCKVDQIMGVSFTIKPP